MVDKEGAPLFPGLREKLKALFFPPGYFPGVRVRPFFHWFTLEDHTEGVPEATAAFFIFIHIIFTIKI
jgi:hypothetical protein